MVEFALEDAFSSLHNILVLLQSSTRLRPRRALESKPKIRSNKSVHREAIA